MKVFHRWPAVLTRQQFVWFRIACWLWTLIWDGAWIYLFLNWDTLNWTNKLVVLGFLALLAPSVSDLVESYDAYRLEQERLYGHSKPGG